MLGWVASFDSALLALVAWIPVPAASPITAIDRAATSADRMRTRVEQPQILLDGSLGCSVGGKSPRVDRIS